MIGMTNDVMMICSFSRCLSFLALTLPCVYVKHLIMLQRFVCMRKVVLLKMGLRLISDDVDPQLPVLSIKHCRV